MLDDCAGAADVGCRHAERQLAPQVLEGDVRDEGAGGRLSTMTVRRTFCFLLRIAMVTVAGSDSVSWTLNGRPFPSVLIFTSSVVDRHDGPSGAAQGLREGPARPLPPHTQAGSRSVRPGAPGCARMAREARKPSRKHRAGDRYLELLRLGRHLLDDAGDRGHKGRKA